MRLPIADCRLPIATPTVAQTGSLRYEKTNAAFTLMEIMIVVGIIGLIAAMGLPSIMSSMQKSGMRKAVSDMEDVFFSAREQAIIHNKTVAVTFYPKERRFGVDGTASNEGGTTVNTHSGKTLVATLPQGVEFGMLDIYHKDYVQSDWAKIYFNSDGTSDEAIIILIAKGGAQSEKLTLEYATGSPAVSAVNQ